MIDDKSRKYCTISNEDKYWINESGDKYKYSDYDNVTCGQGSTNKKNLPTDKYPFTLKCDKCNCTLSVKY